MVLTKNILTPQAFVEHLTGRYYSFRENNPTEEIHKILRLNGIEDEETPLWDYPLQEIDHVFEAGIPVVLVDVSTIDDDFVQYPEWRWFEVPAHLIEFFKANMSKETETEKRHLYIYAEDFDYDVWKEYCDVCGVPHSSTEIKIVFNEEDVEYAEGDE